MKKERRASGVDVRVKGKNVTITPALDDQVVHKMQRLDKYFDRLQEINVELWTESTREADQHSHVEATTRVLGRTLRVTAVHSEMYAAVDEAVDKLYRQLNRRKERTKAHHATKLADLLPAEDGSADSLDAESSGDDGLEAGLPNLRVEQPDLEPMFEDEALEVLEGGTRTFLVFLNARNEQLSVLYRREDGNFGLIEPRIR